MADVKRWNVVRRLNVYTSFSSSAFLLSGDAFRIDSTRIIPLNVSRKTPTTEQILRVARDYGVSNRCLYYTIHSLQMGNTMTTFEKQS